MRKMFPIVTSEISSLSVCEYTGMLSYNAAYIVCRLQFHVLRGTDVCQSLTVFPVITAHGRITMAPDYVRNVLQIVQH